MTGVAARGVSTGSAGKARRPRSRRSPPPPVEGQRWDPIRFARNARFVTELGLPLVELLNPLPGEHILDLGCGDGALTEYLAALGACVVGVDASPEQIAAARGRGVDARLMDGASLDLPPLFDAVFSNAALHWMRRADAVIEGVWRVLKPGGRFIGEMGGHGDVATICAALRQALARRGRDGEAVKPWYFPTPEEYRSQLERVGFLVKVLELEPRPTTLPGELAGWLETFAGDFVNLLPAAERPDFIAEVQALLAPQLRNAEGRWVADYVRLRFKAVKPDS
jgi:SAM-dependent methyltransferase